MTENEKALIEALLDRQDWDMICTVHGRLHDVYSERTYEDRPPTRAVLREQARALLATVCDPAKPKEWATLGFRAIRHGAGDVGGLELRVELSSVVLGFEFLKRAGHGEKRP